MEDIRLVSGPVGVVVVTHSEHTYVLFCDKHNSTSGMCAECRPQDGCVTVHQLMNKVLSSGKRENFFIESPFVLKDTKSSSSYTDDKDVGLDIIEQLQVSMFKSMMRDKRGSKYMPSGYVHYCDIRDVYTNNKYSGAVRMSYSANPLSNSWSVMKLNKHLGNMKKFAKAVNAVDAHTSFILSNARRIVESFVTPNFDPPKGCDNSDFNDRVERMKLMTSTYKGAHRVHRVCKQLLKLGEGDRRSILEWMWARFERELDIAYDIFEVWRKKIQWYISSGEPSMYEDVRELPISTTVAFGSLIMDVYLLARMMYYDDSSISYTYTGAAHVDNYIDYFVRNGGRVESVSRHLQPEQERCIQVGCGVGTM